MDIRCFLNGFIIQEDSRPEQHQLIKKRKTLKEKKLQ